MSVNVLTQQAFKGVQAFTDQVNTIVVREASYKADTTPNISDSSRNQLATVIRTPGSFGFTPTIVADSAWSMGYDSWAADPDSKEGEITGYVQKYWDLLVGPITLNTPPPS